MDHRLVRVIASVGLAAIIVGALAFDFAFERDSPAALAPGTRVREIQTKGNGWVCRVVRRTDDGRYLLARGTIEFLAEPSAIRPCE